MPSHRIWTLYAQSIFCLIPLFLDNLLGVKLRLGKFNYNTTPISKVMADVARHYDIDIQMEMIDSDIYYTGFFDRAKSADTTLKIICNSLGFSFEKETARKYRIKKIIY